MARKPKAPEDTAAPAEKPKRTRKPRATEAKTEAEPTVKHTRKPRAAASEDAKVATKAPRKRKGPVTSKAKPVRSWKRTLLIELATVGLAVTAGLGIAGAVLFGEARRDVRVWLADPPKSTPAVLYSGPVAVREGQHATVHDLAGELLAAGYERVTALRPDPESPRAGQIVVKADSLQVWSAPSTEGGKTKPAETVDIRVVEGVVADISPGTRAQFRRSVLGTVGDRETARSDISLDRIAKPLVQGLLAMEDARFYDHHGVDPVGVLRAVASNLLGKRTQGGSTLTQQLAKNLFLSPERSLRRKVHEALYALALESELSKDELLALYLQEVYLGQYGGVPLYGAEQASQAWFGHSAARLDAAQAATIIGVIPSPNQWSPSRHPERSLERRDLVLSKLHEAGQLNAEQLAAAKARPLELTGTLPGAVRRAPWAMDMAIDSTEQAVGEGALASVGYQVLTTIDPLWQRAAERALREGLAELDKDYPKAAGAQGALVAVRVSDGAVVAMVGSRDYAASPFNRATAAWRQAGSTVKPLTLLGAFDKDTQLTPLTKLDDSQITRRIDGKNWTPRNYDGRFIGDVSVRHAIEGSRNIPAILLAETLGANALQHLYKEAGLSRATSLPSAALGGFEVTALELAGAYTVFPGGGTVKQPWLVDEVRDANGKVVLDFGPKSHALSTDRAAALATHVLTGVVAHGTGARAAYYGVNAPTGGKTGTTDDYRDAWFVGFSPEIVVAVWVGRDKGTLGLSGSRAALPTWSRFMVASGTLGPDFQQPKGITATEVCVEEEVVAKKDCCDATYVEWFADGTVPRETCQRSPLVEMGNLVGGLFRRKKRLQDGEEPAPEPPTP